MREDGIGRELREALDEVYRPAPALLGASMAAVRGERAEPRRSRAAVVAAVLLALLVVAGLLSVRAVLRPATAPATLAPGASLPAPVRQPVTHVDPAAQVAWVTVQAAGQPPVAVAVAPSGRVVAEQPQPGGSTGAAAIYGTWRSPDGTRVFTVDAAAVRSYSALDGSPGRVYARQPGEVVGDAFSPDGRWLALLLLDGGLSLEAIDLGTGVHRALPVPSDAGTAGPAGAAWAAGVPAFAPDSTSLYTVTDWAGRTRLTAFSLRGGELAQTGTATGGPAPFPTCSGPGLLAKVVLGGGTLAAFCHADGAVWLFDLGSLRSAGVVHAQQPNPFWLSPIFTPDGRLLYLNDQVDHTMQVVDLATRRLLGPVATPTAVGGRGPFAVLVPDAYAGGVASTVPVSPDGLLVYAAGEQGVMVLRLSDLEPVARLVPGVSCSEVWVSGDGKTLYVTEAETGPGPGRLLVMRSDGSGLVIVPLAGGPSGFVAAEHG